MSTPPLLLVAHGTRDPEGAEEMATLVPLVAAATGARVAAAWLEDFAEPDAVTASRGLLAEAPADRLVVLPFLNFVAYHARQDVPAQVAGVRAAHPDLDVLVGDVLGAHPALLELATRRLDAVSAPDDREGEVLVVAGSGSSSASANADLARAARLLAERSGHRWVETCFAGVTWPSVAEVLTRAAAAGARRAALFSWSLLAGLLEQRVRAAADEVAATTGLEVVHAGRFGADPLVAEAVAERYRQALGERVAEGVT